MKRSTRKFVHTRESDPSAERHLRNTRRRKVASEPNEPVTYDKVELVHPGVVPVKE